MVANFGQALIRTYSELTLDPRYGVASRETWRGEKKALLGLAAAFREAGYRVEYVDNEGTATLNVIIPQYNDGTAETPQDTWEIENETIQRSIWRNPRLFQAAGSDEDTMAYWRQRTQNALNGNFAQANTDPIEYQVFNPTNKEPLTPEEAGFSSDGPEPYLYKIYVKLLRGEDSFDSTTVVLKRSRVISASYAQRSVVQAIEKVYTTAKLITTFSVPNSIAALLPADPTDATLKPPGTTWGWKTRRDTSQIIVAVNKLQEVKDWIFAAWDNDLYEIVA